MKAKIVAEKDGSLTISLMPGYVIGVDPSESPESAKQLFESLKEHGCAQIVIPTGWRKPNEVFWVEVETIEKK